MGFRVNIQVDYRREAFSSYYPVDQRTHGKVLLNLLTELMLYCDGPKEDEDNGVMGYYRRLDQSQNQSLCDLCQPLLNCMWGDGGDPTEYQADEYALFKEQHLGWPMNEDQFQSLVKSYSAHWQPIGDVLQAVRSLLSVLHQSGWEGYDASFVSEQTLLDLESLVTDLNFLIEHEHTVVRLNFN